MMRRGAIRRWWRRRPRWPLARQIAVVFATAMLVNAFVIIVALEIYGDFVIKDIDATLSPAAKQARLDFDQGKIPDPTSAQKLQAEWQALEPELTANFDLVQNSLVALAALAIFILGYVVFGRMGRGLISIAEAAQQIAQGDLTARATMVSLASREEAQLTTDFNAMAVALQRAERELAEGSAAIAHELRTPLTILRGRLHGISDGVFQLREEEVQGLLYQVDGLGRIVDDLQTLGLSGSGQMALEKADIDLAIEVERVLTAVQPDLEGAGISPMRNLSSAPVNADASRVRQVISAVLSNAQRYAADSGVLRISTRIERDQAVLEIVDHGPGLPPGISDQAFDRFWRAEESRGRKTGGSGLGLAVVRAIVEAHGGHATIANHDGGGTIFMMALPV